MGGIEKARRLRRSMSPAEIALWQYLRTRPNDLKFRRQHPADPYTLDFYCREAAVDIEVDGDAHDMGDNPVRDEIRDAALASHGILTLRFLAADIFDELESVAKQIEDVCASRSPPPRFARSPSPRNRGEEKGKPRKP
jgi:very-short-patch-repair endonuclease